MAARKPIYKNVEVDGVNVKINTDFLKSWDGVSKAVEMQRLSNDESATEGEKMVAIFEYYNSAVSNLDEVVEALGGASIDASVVFESIGKAITAVAGKN